MWITPSALNCHSTTDCPKSNAEKKYVLCLVVVVIVATKSYQKLSERSHNWHFALMAQSLSASSFSSHAECLEVSPTFCSSITPGFSLWQELIEISFFFSSHFFFSAVRTQRATSNKYLSLLHHFCLSLHWIVYLVCRPAPFSLFWIIEPLIHSSEFRCTFNTFLWKTLNMSAVAMQL